MRNIRLHTPYWESSHNPASEVDAQPLSHNAGLDSPICTQEKRSIDPQLAEG